MMEKQTKANHRVANREAGHSVELDLPLTREKQNKSGIGLSQK
jgi:hypothetical protein